MTTCEISLPNNIEIIKELLGFEFCKNLWQNTWQKCNVIVTEYGVAQ